MGSRESGVAGVSITLILSALMKLINSGRWINESQWVEIINHADKKTLLYLKDEGFWSIKYFTRDDWLGVEVRDRLLPLVNERLKESDTIATIMKGLF